MKQLRNILILFLLIFCFASCNEYNKDIMEVQGVVTQVIPVEELSHFNIKAKVKVDVDAFNEAIFFYTCKDVDVGDTIDIELIFYKKNKIDSKLD